MLRNIVANFIGRFWSILSNFLFIPLYIHYLGFESYSVISFTLVVAGLMAILDGGLTATLSREFARKDTEPDEKVNIFKTLESIYLIVTVVVICMVFCFSEIFATKWLNNVTFGPDKLSLFFKIISFDIGFQLLLRFYMGGLLGLEKQVTANIFQMFWGIIRNGVVVVVILFIPRLDVFFLWQTISTLIFVLFFRLSLSKSLTGSFFTSLNFGIDKFVINKIWKFAGGMMLISLVAALNTQMDKLAISKLLPIESLGYYSLAVSLATGLVVVVNPISTALLPRFTSLYTIGKKNAAVKLFEKSNIYIAILLFPLFIAMTIFPEELIWIWTGSSQIAEKTNYLLPLIAFAYTMLAFQILPYTIAIANGYTKLNNIMGIISLFVTLPGYWLIVRYKGDIGVAAVFALVQFFTTFIYMYIINKKYLGSTKNYWGYLKLYGLEFITTVIIVFLFSLIMPPFVHISRVLSLLWIGVAILISMIVCFRLFMPKEEQADMLLIMKRIKIRNNE